MLISLGKNAMVLVAACSFICAVSAGEPVDPCVALQAKSVEFWPGEWFAKPLWKFMSLRGRGSPILPDEMVEYVCSDLKPYFGYLLWRSGYPGVYRQTFGCDVAYGARRRKRATSGPLCGILNDVPNQIIP